MNIFLVMEIWALCSTSSYMLNTMSIASKGSLMCNTLLAEDEGHECSGFMSLGYMRLGLSLGLIATCLWVSHCSFVLSEELRV
jgi:hypothetical protein